MKCPNCDTESNGNFCEKCGTTLVASDVNTADVIPPTTPPAPNAKPPKKPITKRLWVWVVIGILCVVVMVNIGKSKPTSTPNASPSPSANVVAAKADVTVVDFSAMTKDEIKAWADTNKVTCNVDSDYSDTVETGKFISQNKNANEVVKEGDTIKVIFSLGKKPSVEFQNALRKAESYSKTMHMSKQGIYNQLTSEYGEKFPADAAQYAVDNMEADWNANALEKAKSYQKTMNMSSKAIYDQLTSKHGENFTKTEAQYAIDHLND